MSVRLDDPAAVARVDISGMLGQMASLPAQLNASLSHRLRRSVQADKVLIGGLGGSAMGGDVVAEYMAANSRTPAAVVRDTTLPRWADERTLVMLISYSGNTRETLALYEEAQTKGCPLVVITSGGSLGQLAGEAGEELITIPPGLQPRAALGHLLGSAAGVVESAGLAPMVSDLRAVLPELERLRDELRPESPVPHNQAKQVAQRLLGTLPFVYAPRSIRSAATRWQTQINENAKMLCLSGEVPEMDHNQIVGWIDGAKDPRNLPVMLRPRSEEGMGARIMQTTIDLLADFQLDPVVVDLDGPTALSNALQGMMVGDFVSYYLAILQGIDPMPVPSITELKRRLG